jgi:hypothetical protein
LKVLLAEALAKASGGARRDRTADLVNAIHALSQLSYGPSQDQGTAVRYQEIALRLIPDV